MNEHVKKVLEVAEQPSDKPAVFVQNDSDYPVDPLDGHTYDGEAEVRPEVKAD